jgi:hypothetical protein
LQLTFKTCAVTVAIIVCVSITFWLYNVIYYLM